MRSLLFRFFALCLAAVLLTLPATADEFPKDEFADSMVEYVNTEMGFAIQYPAVFETVVMTREGVSGELADGSAGFFARSVANEQGMTLENWIAAQQEAYPAALMTMNEFSMSVRMTHQREDGMFQADMVIITGEWMYEAQLVYAQSVAPDFVLYSDYMLNSFAADELGQG